MAYAWRGLAYEQLGRKVEAIADLRSAITLLRVGSPEATNMQAELTRLSAAPR